MSVGGCVNVGEEGGCECGGREGVRMCECGGGRGYLHVGVCWGYIFL